ncbi:MAG: agmatinase [Planctomycetaceae bacterium]|nr:agmatinase [Planctomycetaceae bacterium]
MKRLFKGKAYCPYWLRYNHQIFIANFFMSFFRLPKELSDPATAKFLIQPVPYEGTVSFLKGTVNGPDAILAVSDQVEHFDEELLFDMTQHGVATLPSIPPANSPEEQFELIYNTVRERNLFQRGRIPIFLGGEHSITPPIVRVAAEEYDEISVLQFDAHADLRDSYTGTRYSHGSAMRRSLEYTPNIVQVGIRSFSEEEVRDCPDQVKRFITPMLLAGDYSFCLDQILHRLSKQVYISIDIDAFDPAFAPGTGTPEPGGLSWREVTSILRRVCEEKNIVGIDVVEVAPLGGNNVVTEFTAARLIGKLMAYTTKLP